MAAATSPATGQAYGVKRVCTIWDVARSSFYDAQRQDARSAGRPAGRRGPRPAVSDADLLAAIRRDLDRSLWSGEGHRKVWARLRVIDGILVSRSRVLRIMRENSLLSPHRRPPRPATDHDGSIITEAPNVMWGADGAVIPTVEDGNVTLFIVAEHWNGEGLGWHVAKSAVTATPPLRRWQRPSTASSAPSALTPRGGCRCATTTAARSCPSTSRTS